VSRHVQIEISQKVRQRIAIGAGVVLVILGWAWWDGGEEPLHPMEQTVNLAEAGQ
jgi:hypothetical protein